MKHHAEGKRYGVPGPHRHGGEGGVHRREDGTQGPVRNLQSMDEYMLDHELRDMLNEKLSHTQEYLTELQVNQHPDAKKPAIELVSEVQDYNDIRPTEYF